MPSRERLEEKVQDNEVLPMRRKATSTLSFNSCVEEHVCDSLLLLVRSIRNAFDQRVQFRGVFGVLYKPLEPTCGDIKL